MDDYPELKGKAAIVTGGTAGIGKSISRCLAHEGVDVAIVGRDVERGEEMERILRELGTASFFARCDVVNPDDVVATYDEAMCRLGRVDIMINCAGGFTRLAEVTEYTVDDWNYIVDCNLRSAFLFTRLVLPGMVERKWGRIVNISSVAGQGVPYLNSAIYAAAKAGMIGFTRHVAAEVARYGVTVNATAPGFTLSERVARLLTPDMISERAKPIPMGRPSKPDEQAWIVVFLCSNRASYITGATIAVNGGTLMV